MWPCSAQLVSFYFYLRNISESQFDYSIVKLLHHVFVFPLYFVYSASWASVQLRLQNFNKTAIGSFHSKSRYSSRVSVSAFRKGGERSPPKGGTVADRGGNGA